MRGEKDSMNAEDLMIDDETGKTTPPGQSGDAAEQGAEKALGEGSPEAGGEGADLDWKGKVPPEVQEKIDRRIGKITAKHKAAEERMGVMEAELNQLKAEREEAEAAKTAHLGVPPEYFEGDELKTIEKAEADLLKAENAVASWERYADSDDGYVDQETGKSYTPAQCARFAAEAAKMVGRAEGVKGLIVDRAQKRLRNDLRELKAAKARPKPGAGAPEAPATPRRIDSPDDGTGAPRGGAPARPADTPPTPGAAAKVPQSQDQARAWLDD